MKKSKPNCQCTVCKKAIYRAPKSIQKGNVYCSLVCCGLNQRRLAEKKKQSSSSSSSSLKITLAHLRGGVCEKCQYNNFAILNVHHIIEVCNGGSDDLDSLLLLCPNCHAVEHLNRPTNEDILSDD